MDHLNMGNLTLGQKLRPMPTYKQLRTALQNAAAGVGVPLTEAARRVISECAEKLEHTE